MALAVLALVAWNAVVLWLVYTGRMDRDVGNDPAGDGMSRAFREAFAVASGIGVAVLAAPVLIAPWRTLRVVFLFLLAVASVLTPMLL